MAISLPKIQIRQEYAQLGIDADLGQYDMKQPRSTLEMKQTNLRYEIHSPNGELRIDQSKAWDALGLGNNLETMNHIYSEAKNIALQGIARRAQMGDRLANIASGENVIAANAAERFLEFQEFDFYGPASFDNVDVYYTAHKPEIEPIPGNVEMNTQVNAPEVKYNRGKLDIYVQNYGKVEITPPQIDMLA